MNILLAIFTFIFLAWPTVKSLYTGTFYDSGMQIFYSSATQPAIYGSNGPHLTTALSEENLSPFTLTLNLLRQRAFSVRDIETIYGNVLAQNHRSPAWAYFFNRFGNRIFVSCKGSKSSFFITHYPENRDTTEKISYGSSRFLHSYDVCFDELFLQKNYATIVLFLHGAVSREVEYVFFHNLLEIYHTVDKYYTADKKTALLTHESSSSFLSQAKALAQEKRYTFMMLILDTHQEVF